MADEFVRAKLRDWNLEILQNTFEENVIDQESFHLLDADSIKELIPRVGLRIRFSNYHRVYMEEFTKVFNAPPPPEPVDEVSQHAVRQSIGVGHVGGMTPALGVGMGHAVGIGGDGGTPPTKRLKQAQKSQALNFNSSSEESTPQRQPNFSSQPSLKASPSSDAPTLRNRRNKWSEHGPFQFDIREILNNFGDGQTIVQCLDEKKWISLPERRAMVRILASHLMELCGNYPSTEAKVALCMALIEQFPCLKDPEGLGYEAYYTKSGHAGHAATGYIEERIRNLRKKRLKPPKMEDRDKEKGRTPPPKQTKQGGGRGKKRSMWEARTRRVEDMIKTGPGPSEEELGSLQAWLQAHREPLDTIQEHMATTALDRLRWRMEHPDKPISVLLEKYPRLLDTQGMIDQDFKVLYPEYSERLAQTWTSTMVDQIIQYADAQQRCWLDRLGIPKYSGDIRDPVERSNVAFQVLPYILPTNIARTRVSVDQRARAFIDVRPVGFDPQTYLNSMDTSMYPFILLIGSREAPSQIYVVFQDSAMLEPDLMKAVDECFKLFHILSIAYPVQCSVTWEFVQKLIFDLPDSNPFTTPAVRMLRIYMHQQDQTDSQKKQQLMVKEQAV